MVRLQRHSHRQHDSGCVATELVGRQLSFLRHILRSVRRRLDVEIQASGYRGDLLSQFLVYADRYRRVYTSRDACGHLFGRTYTVRMESKESADVSADTIQH